jgi:hypothetical protein
LFSTGLRRALSGGGTSRVLWVLALTVLTAAAAWVPRQTSAAPATQENPRLASLDIDIWPEYDRPAMLVILHAALADDVTLPATVSLHIPASSGGPSAMASAPTEDGALTNLDYETAEESDSLLLKFTTPDRFVQVEFYDAVATQTADRGYSYAWPGDLAVGESTVRVQEPLGAGSLSVEPDIGTGTLDADGFAYRSADLGALESGQTLSISMRYQKTDPRTSLEILNAARESDSGMPSWLLPVAVAAFVVAATGMAVYWRSHRQAAPVLAGAGPVPRRRGRQRVGARAGSRGFCTQCGHQLDEGSRFCSRCGLPVRGG